MRVLPVVLLLALLALPLAAQSASGQAPAQPADPRLTTLSHDLYAVERIATLARDIGDSRQVILAMLDSDIDALREPRDNGTYRWASLQREESGRVVDEKSVEQVQTEKELRNVTISAPNAYRVVVLVPAKRNLVSGNNRVFVRNISVESTSFEGKTTLTSIPVNAWVNPGDTTEVALPEIGKSVKATAELGVESGSKRAVAQVALLQAKLIDDPASPFYPAVRRLLRLRDVAAAKNLDRASLKSLTDEALLALPGEMEQRTLEQERAIAERRALTESGQMKGSIARGDATPDVVSELQRIRTLLGGTVTDQAEGRTRLETLIGMLQPPVAPTATPQP